MVQDLPTRYQWLLVSFTLHFAHRLSPRSFNRLMPLARATSLHLYTSPKNANRKTATAFPSFLLAQRSRGESHLLDERKNVDGNLRREQRKTERSPSFRNHLCGAGKRQLLREYRENFHGLELGRARLRVCEFVARFKLHAALASVRARGVPIRIYRSHLNSLTSHSPAPRVSVPPRPTFSRASDLAPSRNLFDRVDSRFPPSRSPWVHRGSSLPEREAIR